MHCIAEGQQCLIFLDAHTSTMSFRRSEEVAFLSKDDEAVLGELNAFWAFFWRYKISFWVNLKKIAGYGKNNLCLSGY